MKFNCDRCKTRYSISDERVRGKVLKIRCKNCSAVITVREGMADAAPRTPSQPASGSSAAPAPTQAAATAPARAKSESALRGAFDDAMRAPAAADSMTGAPAQLTTEWYVAINGDQSGPFDVDGAKGWILEQPQSAELYCWSEGFDDWLPIEKVSQFRGARDANGANGLAPAIGHGTPLPSLGALAATGDHTIEQTIEHNPQPLFAATMKQVAAEAPTLLEDDDPMSAGYRGAGAASVGASDPMGGFELDIGEASRVVNLASLVPPGAGAAGVAAPLAPNALPGIAGPGAGIATGPVISGATSPEIEMPRADVLQPKPSSSKILLPLLLASGVLVVVLGVLLFLAFSRSGDAEEEIARGGASGTEGLATAYEPTTRPNGSGSAEKAPVDKGKQKVRKPKVVRNSTKVVPKTNGSKYTPNDGEVDLSGTVSRDDIKQGSLDPTDISSVYRKKQFSVNRCYERAIKKNPLLKVGKAYVTLNVSTSGSVTKVSIPSLSREDLGGCLVATIGRWRFPKSTEGFRGSFPILFKSN